MKKCPECKGKGHIALFTSVVECLACKKPDSGVNKAKQKLISEYLKTPEGRARLRVCLTPVSRCGGRDYKRSNGRLLTKIGSGDWEEVDEKALKQQIIAKLIKTPAGMGGVAEDLRRPLRTRRDINSVGRKTFSTEDLPEGALPEYDEG